MLTLSGAAFKELFKTEVVIPGFGGRSLNTIIRIISQTPVIASKKRKVLPVFFKEVSVKKKIISGMITRKVIPVSFDSNARKKLIPIKINDQIDFDERYFN